MPNAVHILETALLILVAFLIGCVIGYLLRRLASARKPKAIIAIAAAAPAPAEAPTGPQLVVAPAIAPLSPKPSAAQRLAAVASGTKLDAAVAEGPPQSAEPATHGLSGVVKMPEMALLHDAPLTIAPILPAHVAGEATSGRAVPSPHEAELAPDVVPEAPDQPVLAAEVPEIDEAAHVVAFAPAIETIVEVDEPPATAIEVIEQPFTPAELPAAVEVAPEAVVPPAVAIETIVDVEPIVAAVVPPILASPPPIEASVETPVGPEPAVVPLTPTVTATTAPPAEDGEEAAMRAVEGGWTPRRRATKPVPFPEDKAPEVSAAMETARSAVAAATAAAEAVLAEAEPVAPTEAEKDKVS